MISENDEEATVSHKAKQRQEAGERDDNGVIQHNVYRLTYESEVPAN